VVMHRRDIRVAHLGRTSLLTNFLVGCARYFDTTARHASMAVEWLLGWVQLRKTEPPGALNL
jgi:hypothetical protein